LFKPFVKVLIAYSPPLGDIRVLSIGIKARSLILGFTALRAKMLARGLVHNDTFIFDGTNYDTWRIRMFNYFWVMEPNIERIVDMGFSPHKDPMNLSSEDEKNTYLNAQAINVLSNVVSIVVVTSIMPFRDARVFWTKLQEKYDVSKFIEDECIPSTFGRDEVSSTLPMCGKMMACS
jgi:hypothetical protein